MTVNAGRTAFLPADRGGRQHQKIMQLLAAVEADRARPLVETLIGSVARLRRGMTAVVITASIDPAWVRPLAALRTRGVACVVVALDAPGLRPGRARGRAATTGERRRRRSEPRPRAAAKRARALRHALAEYELRSFTIRPGPAARRDPRPDEPPCSRCDPSEGWLTLGLVVVLCLTLAWSLDDAALVLGQGEYTDFLAWTASAGRRSSGSSGPRSAGAAGRRTSSGRCSPRSSCRSWSARCSCPTRRGPRPAVRLDGRGDRHGVARPHRPRPARDPAQIGHHLLVLGLLVWAIVDVRRATRRSGIDGRSTG